MNLLFNNITQISNALTSRVSSWDLTGRNNDYWTIEPRESMVLADIEGPGVITHIWMTQREHYREAFLKITWDNASIPSVLVPLGDFFCLGNGIVNSFQSYLFSASAKDNNVFNGGCALNCYVQMPFRERAVVELINESDEPHKQYFYIDYEKLNELPAETGYFHAEFNRTNPFGGWGHEITVNSAESNIRNKEELAWNNNYVILNTKGRGHYIGCNLSVTNLQGTWWGEGDDMIWVDGYKWPPDLHGTGSEDYFNQAWGMQPNAFSRNGSSIYEDDTGGYQTSYVFHLENPVRYQNEIKVTIEHGHANHLANEMSSVAYWYSEIPTAVSKLPTIKERLPVMKDDKGDWIGQSSVERVEFNDEMIQAKKSWVINHGKDYINE